MSKLPVILQTERAECGLACISMILCYFGYQTNLMALRQRFHLSGNGMNLEDMVNIASELELNSRPLKLEPQSLKDLATPCILHWNMNHFVVLRQVRGDKVMLHDPATGVRQCSLTEVSKSFTGVALELTPAATFRPQNAAPKFKLSQLWHKVVGLKRNVGKIILLSIFFQIFALAVPYYLQTAIDRVIPTSDRTLLLILAVGFGLVLLFQHITYVVRTYVITWLSAAFSIQAGTNLFRHLLHLPLHFFENRDVGDIVSRFDSLHKVKDFLTNSFAIAIIDGMLVLSVLAVMFYYNSLLTLLVLGFSALYLIFRILAFYHFRRINEEEIRTKAKERTDFIENIQNIQTVLSFDAQTVRTTQWSQYYTDAVESGVQVLRTKEWYKVANQIILGVENILLIYFFVLAILNHSMTVGMLVAYLAYKRIFTARFTTLVDVIIEYRMLGLHLERISDIALKDKTPDAPIDHHRVCSGNIRLNNVSYSYDDFSRPVLNRLNLTIERGDYIAITGPSGVGKSTLVKILMGLETPSQGNMEIDGIDITTFGKRNYRRHVAAVMQDEKLYAGSILDNLTFFSPEPNMEKAVRCCQQAQLHEMIMRKPMGYRTLLSHLGNSLSGGERQRLLLARALYRDPEILILDEATSNLDVKTEAAINHAIESLNITRIVIAHRPQTIKSASRVLRLSRQGLTEVIPGAFAEPALVANEQGI